MNANTASESSPTTKTMLEKLEVLKRPAAVFAGTTSAWLLQQNWNLASPLVAAATVGFCSTPMSPLKAYQAPLYCGAFAGTTSIGIVTDPRIALGLACITSIMFETFERKKLFPGRGGRLGMCATLSSTILTLLNGRLNVPKELIAYFGNIFGQVAASPDALSIATNVMPGITNTVLPSFVIASFGAVLSTFMRRRGLGPVPSSAICGLLGTTYIRGSLGGLFYMGSFIGMSADANDSSQVDYRRQILAAILSTTFFLGLGQYILAGVGGKLGAAALLGVLSSSSLLRRAAIREKFVGTLNQYKNMPQGGL